MNFLSTFTFLLILSIKSVHVHSIQSYDKFTCPDTQQVPGTNYLCNSKKLGCKTYLVYRAQENQTLSSITSLFNIKLSDLNDSNPGYQDPGFLYPGRLISIPFVCHCNDPFSHGTFSYNNSNSYSLSRIACEVYQGLMKSQTLIQQNQNLTGNLVQVPVKCACPEVSDVKNGINYLVTYPIQDADNFHSIAPRFGVAENAILEANGLGRYAAIFAETTLIIPTKDIPVINSTSQSIAPSSPQNKIPVDMIIPGKKFLRQINLAPFIAGTILTTLVLSCGVLIFIRRRYHPRRFQPLSGLSMPSSPFSPDFLDGMSKLKHSLISFSLEELRLATDNFSKNCLIGSAVYKGRIGGNCLAIERMNSIESARRVVHILTKINHLNVVRLEGCLYGEKSYLVFEFAENGSLRECLSDAKIKKQLAWGKRLQIACDVAEGLHYLHYCTKPTYVHMNINSRYVLIAKDWRAKISGFKLARPLMFNEEKGETSWNGSVIAGNNKGYLAPEYLDHGEATTKMDVYAFGVILLELLSGKEVITEGKWLKDCIGFLAVAGGEDSASCLDKFKGFMDPELAGTYPLGDAISLALLAKGCTEDDPVHRPTMNDILKAFSRIQ